MEIALIVVGVVAVVGVGVALWLAIERGKMTARGAMLESQVLGAAREREEVVGRLASAEGEASARRVEVQKLSVEVAALGEKLAAESERVIAAQKRVAEEVADAETLFAQEREGLIARHADRIASDARVHSEQLSASEEKRKGLEALLVQMREQMPAAFGLVAAEAMKKNNAQFLELAEQKLSAKTSAVDELVKPIGEALKRTDATLAVLKSTGEELRGETGKLVRALREPHVRGRYGEIQLRRVAELAGMTAYCDFAEQDQRVDGDGNALRPDMIVKMPGGRTVVVDAKTNIQGYLDAISAATPSDADVHLARFARHVSEQATALGKKKYYTQYDGSPEFVVMFIPGDQFIDAALQRHPEIIEKAAGQNVILASPSTLIGLLRAVQVGYKEQALASAAEELRELGKELHERVATAMGHIARLGKSINASADAYNDFVGSYEKRVEPTLKKFEESGVKSGKELPEHSEITERVRIRPMLFGHNEIPADRGDST